MKKSLIAMIAVALFATSAMAQVLIYDYSVSFKRLEVKVAKNVKVGNTKVSLDSAKVASDKFTGYVVIAACDNCDTNEWEDRDMKASTEGGALYPDSDEWPGDVRIDTTLTALDNNDVSNYRDAYENYAVVYLTAKFAGKKVVYRAVGGFRANMFGAKTGVMLLPATIAGTPVNTDKFTDATGFLTFPMDWSKVDSNGFLGYDNFTMFQDEDYVDAVYGDQDLRDDEDAAGTTDWLQFAAAPENCFAYNGGYGKVENRTQTIDYGCYTDTNGCYIVKNLSGSFLGATNYMGICSDFLFDVCTLNIDSTHVVPLNGTFTMKLNNSLTYNKKVFANATFAAAEAAILGKLNYTALYRPAEDDKAAALGLITGSYWD